MSTVTTSTGTEYVPRSAVPAAVRQRPRTGAALLLADLHGPADGVHEPPRRLWWSGEPSVNFGNLGEVALFYEAVLDTATAAEDLADWLNPALLMELWPSLGMQPGQRKAWESLNPQLGHAEVQAAA